MKLKKILFLGSKPIGFHTLHHLIKNMQSLGCEIAGVLSNDNLRFDATLSVKQLAIDYNIRFISSLNDILEFSDIDIIISIQYHEILKKKHIDVAKQIAINLHMAPLPEYRGCNQFSFALLEGAKEFGTTIHQLEEGIDSGAILFEKRFQIPETAYVNELYNLTYEASVDLFKSHIADIIKGNYQLKPQADYIKTRGTAIHYRHEIKTLKTLTLDNQTIRKVRATAMPGFEPPFAMDGSKKIYLVPEEIFNKYNKQQ